MEGGAKIKEWFLELYKEYTGPYDCTKDMGDDHIETAIISHQGDQLAGFPSMDLFMYLIMPEVQKLRMPAEELVDKVHSYLLQLCQDINSKIFMRFATLEQAVAEVTNKILAERK